MAERSAAAAGLLVGLIMAGQSQLALANPIIAGETVAPDVFVNSPGTSIASEGFSFNANDFTYTVFVYQVPTSAPSDGLCAGCLNYIVTLHTDPGATINQISLSDFAGPNLDVGYNTELGNGQTGAPVSVSDSANGTAITFNFAPGSLNVQGTTDFLEIETNSTSFTTGSVCGLDQGSLINCGAGFQPVDMPEPASMAVLGAAVIGLGLLRRRRRDSVLTTGAGQQKSR